MDQLGIDAKLLVAQMVNFFIILFVLSKLLYKPILEMLDKRKETIKKSLELSEQIEKEKLHIEELKEKAMEKARVEAVQLMEEAKARGKDEEKEIIKEAKAEAVKILEKAKKDAEEVKRDMQKSIRNDAISLAEAMTKRLVSRVLDQKAQQELLSKEIKNLSMLHA